MGTELIVNKPGSSNRAKKIANWTQDEQNAVSNWLFTFKLSLLKFGYLCYDDAYLLAGEYLRTYPGIIKIIQQRFQYVFVDEMQDLDKHQYDCKFSA